LPEAVRFHQLEVNLDSRGLETQRNTSPLKILKRRNG